MPNIIWRNDPTFHPGNMNRLRLLFAWLLVGVPLGWGVSRSVLRSMPLFAAAPTAEKSSQGDPHLPDPKDSIPHQHH